MCLAHQFYYIPVNQIKLNVFAAPANNQPRRIGSIADIDPANGVYGSVSTDHNNYHQHNLHQHSRTAQQQLKQSQPAIPKSIQKSISNKVVRAFFISSE